MDIASRLNCENTYAALTKKDFTREELALAHNRPSTFTMLGHTQELSPEQVRILSLSLPDFFQQVVTNPFSLQEDSDPEKSCQNELQSTLDHLTKVYNESEQLVQENTIQAAGRAEIKATIESLTSLYAQMTINIAAREQIAAPLVQEQQQNFNTNQKKR